MKFRFVHNNFNVLHLERSLNFYREALGLHEARRVERPEFTLVYLEDGVTGFQLELTWLKERTGAYDLGEAEFHLAFAVDDYAGALAHHRAMGCVAMENSTMGIYFITDPDGYFLEIIPSNFYSKHP